MFPHNQLGDDWLDGSHHHDRHHFAQFFFDFGHFARDHHNHLPPTLPNAMVSGKATRYSRLPPPMTGS